MKAHFLFVLLLILSFSKANAQCEAHFTYNIGQNGLVEFTNTSGTSLDGDVQYIMTIDGGTIIAGPDYSYQFAPGTYSICIGMAVLMNNSPICTDSFCESITIEEENCPTEISVIETEECGFFQFEAGSFVEGEEVIWYFGNVGPITGGHFIGHQFSEPGVYVVTCGVSNSLCTYIQLSVEVVVPDCSGTCTEVSIGMDSYLNAGGPEVVYWWISNGNGGSVESGVAEYSANDQAYDQVICLEDGCYELVVEGMNVANAELLGIFVQANSNTIIQNIEIQNDNLVTITFGVNSDCTVESICPTEIIITPGELCHQYIFSVNNWGESPFGDINWNFGDNAGSGQNDFLHMYLEPGDFEVCVYGSTETCPNGFEICTNLEVSACGGDENNDGCPDFIWGYPLDDCGLWHFEAGPGQELMTVSYDWGDGTQTDATTIADHQYEADGIYIVTLTYFSNTCSETIQLIYTVEVNACEGSDCPTEIAVIQTEECGFFQFEAGSFVEGEEFTWYFGNAEPVSGGHFITHQFDAPGTYLVNCTLSNNNCPFTQLAVEVVVADCFANCTEVNIGLDSYMELGGPEIAHWSISDSNGETVESGNAEYALNDPYFDYTACLEDGCYILHVEGMHVANAELMDIFVSSNLENIIQNVEVQNENLVSITFGINSDCTVECTPSSILFVSNVITGSTHCVAYSITDINNNESITSGVSEFSEQIQTVNNEFCLPDGCYSITFDSCDPLNAGTGLSYQLFVANVNVLANAVPVYQDNHAITYEFSLNSDCSIANECVASFDAEFTNALGNVTLYNTSTFTGGNAEYFWQYGNGQTSTNESITVSFNPPGYYYVCLTMNTANCNSTYCATLYFPVTNEICTDNIVNLSINSEYIDNLSDVLSITFNSEFTSFDIDEISTSGGDGLLAVCLPDDCYEVVINAAGIGLLAETFEMEIESPSETITFPINTGATEFSAWLGVNTDCIISTPEFESGSFSIYPNPANAIIQISMTNFAPVSNFEILDATGRLVLSGKYNGSIDVSALFPGAYVMKIKSNGDYSIGRFMKEN